LPPLPLAERRLPQYLSYEQELKEAFSVFDADNNGRISATELMSVLKNIDDSITEEEIDLMIKEADLNGDGEMDWGKTDPSLRRTSDDSFADEFVKVMIY
jgi:hypothetical protein